MIKLSKLSTKDIVASIREKSGEENEDSENEDVILAEPEERVVTRKAAQKGLDDLRLLIQQSNCDEINSLLNIVDDKFMKLLIKQSVQTKIRDFTL
jgi:hypothetical protein